jgi:hypothetical protein
MKGRINANVEFTAIGLCRLSARCLAVLEIVVNELMKNSFDFPGRVAFSGEKVLDVKNNNQNASV